MTWFFRRVDLYQDGFFIVPFRKFGEGIDIFVYSDDKRGRLNFIITYFLLNESVSRDRCRLNRRKEAGWRAVRVIVSNLVKEDVMSLHGWYRFLRGTCSPVS